MKKSILFFLLFIGPILGSAQTIQIGAKNLTE